jgi:arginine deiminase
MGESNLIMKLLLKLNEEEIIDLLFADEIIDKAINKLINHSEAKAVRMNLAKTIANSLEKEQLIKILISIEEIPEVNAVKRKTDNKKDVVSDPCSRVLFLARVKR